MKKSESNKTLIVNYPTMNMGGIESVCHAYIKYAIAQGVRVIWLCYPEMQIAESFKDVLNSIERVRVNKSSSKDILIDSLHIEGDVVVLSFTPLFLSRALMLSKNYPHCNIVNLYIVANTRGRYYYAEESFWGLSSRLVAAEAKKYNQLWAKQGYVRFFTNLQAEAFEHNYDYIFDDKKEIVIPPAFETKALDEQILKGKISRKEFNLISVTRFQFPHKQYLIGLIKDYGILKKKYPQIKLHIVGYGPGQSLVNETINNLDKDSQKDVTLYGELGAEEIAQLMNGMHLNISVAGSVVVGARNGVLSIPARNFCEGECEVYGFLPESYELITATKPGMRAINYIEEVINMSDDEYEEKCRESYYACCVKDARPNYIYEQKNTPMDYDVVKKAFNFYRRVALPGDICYKIKKTLKGE